MIIIETPQYLRALIEQAGRDGTQAQLADGLLRLLHLHLRYLTDEDGEQRRDRSAIITADFHSNNRDLNWAIMDGGRRVLNGGLVFDRHQKTWGIHT